MTAAEQLGHLRGQIELARQILDRAAGRSLRASVKSLLRAYRRKERELLAKAEAGGKRR